MAISRNDKRYDYKGFTKNPLVSQGQSAFAQCLQPVLDFVKLQKNIINKFDDKGRPDHKVEYVDFRCVIVQEGATSRQSSSTGDRSTARFTVTYLAPAKLQIGDILEHEHFGIMKIVDFTGTAQFGVTSASAVRLGASEDIEDGDVQRKEIKDIL